MNLIPSSSRNAHYAFFVLVLIFTSLKAQGAITYTWTGTTNTSWTTTTNWSPSSGSDYPGHSDVSGDDIVVIPNTTNKPVLSSKLTYAIASLTINNSTQVNVTTGDTLLVTGTTTVNGDLNMQGTSVLLDAGSGTLTGSGSIHVNSTSSTDDLYFQYDVNTRTFTNLNIYFDGANSHTNHSFSCANIYVDNGFGVSFNGACTVSVSGIIYAEFNIVPGASTIVNGTINNTLVGGITVTATGNANDLTTQYPGTLNLLSTGYLYMQGAAAQNLNISSVKNLYINTSSGVTMTGNTNVTGTLVMQSGKLILGTNTLTISSGATVSGYASNTYINTNSTGTLTMAASSGGTVYPVGATDYTPITITDASANTYSVGVAVGVTSNDGSTAVPNWTINRTWTITSTGSSSITVTPQWSTSDKAGSNFDLTDAFVATRDLNNTNVWTPGTGSTAGGSNPYTQSLSGISITAGDVYNVGVGGGTSSPLPVSLLDFNAAYANHAANLTWQTASEQNNNYFEIERAADGQNWQSIGTLPGHGNSEITESYAFTDNLAGIVPGPTIYYRLKQVDFNGNFQFSPVKALEINSLNTSLSVYPVPAGNFMNIDWNNPESDNCTFTIANTMGAIVYHETVVGNGLIHRQINMSAYPSGVYIITISSGQNTIKKLIEKD